MVSPFHISGPASISFSGGRTSGYMLWRILQAHDGTLPDDVVVTFANTGKEMPQTLDFVQECSARWAVPIAWLEYRYHDGGHTFAVVDRLTASTNGEPFADVIKHRRMLPNPRVRFCTVELKVRTMHRYLRSIGYTDWTSYVGIRADEPRRVARLGNQDYGTHEVRRAPLAEAGISVQDVGAFWSAQSFDLGLPSMNGKTMHGNCDLCFLKGAKQVASLIAEDPSRADWWIGQEDYARQTFADRTSEGSRSFRNDRPQYATMKHIALHQLPLLDGFDEPIEDCVCVD